MECENSTHHDGWGPESILVVVSSDLEAIDTLPCGLGRAVSQTKARAYPAVKIGAGDLSN